MKEKTDGGEFSTELLDVENGGRLHSIGRSSVGSFPKSRRSVDPNIPARRNTAQHSNQFKSLREERLAKNGTYVVRVKETSLFLTKSQANFSAIAFEAE